MKIVVISDSHGNIANLRHVMGFAKRIKADVVIHCGDFSDLKSVETVMSFKIPLYGVLGNADIGDEITKKFEKSLEIEIGGKRIGIIHDIKKADFKMKNLDIIFFGHWQKQKEIFWNGIHVVNPGALENDVNFAIYDTTSDKIDFINE